MYVLCLNVGAYSFIRPISGNIGFYSFTRPIQKNIGLINFSNHGKIAPVLDDVIKFSSFLKIENFCPSMALSRSVSVVKPLTRILFGSVQNDCSSLDLISFHNFSIY